VCPQISYLAICCLFLRSSAVVTKNEEAPESVLKPLEVLLLITHLDHTTSGQTLTENLKKFVGLANYIHFFYNHSEALYSEFIVGRPVKECHV
jgi:hypothetical protein